MNAIIKEGISVHNDSVWNNNDKYSAVNEGGPQLMKISINDDIRIG